MKQWVLPTLVVVAVGLFFWGIRYELSKQAEKRREAGYQSDLRSYSLVLKPGMSRKEVESYLRGRSAEFSHDSWDDLVKIGEEEHPWFCSEHFVYVAFHFVDHVPVGKGFSFKGDDSDILKSVSIYHQLGGCL